MHLLWDVVKGMICGFLYSDTRTIYVISSRVCFPSRNAVRLMMQMFSFSGLHASSLTPLKMSIA